MQIKPIWAAEVWKDISVYVWKLAVKAGDVDSHTPRSWAAEEHDSNGLEDWAAKTEVSWVDLDWQHKGELFLAHWAPDTSGHQGRDAK